MFQRQQLPPCCVEHLAQQQAVILESAVSRLLLTAPPPIHGGLSCTDPLLRSTYQSSISAAHIRQGELSRNFWIYAGPSRAIAEIPGRRWTPQASTGRSTHGWSEGNSPRSKWGSGDTIYASALLSVLLFRLRRNFSKLFLLLLFTRSKIIYHKLELCITEVPT